MTNAQALDLMMARLGGRTSPTLRATMVLELNLKIQEFEHSNPKPWFLQDIKEDVLVANQRYIDLPADFLMEIEEGKFLVWDGQKWGDPKKVYFRDIQENTENVDPAWPEGYTLLGEKLYLGPTPDQNYAYRLPYYKKTVEVVDNTSAIDNKWLLNFFNYVSLSTVYQMASVHTQSAEVVAKVTGPLSLAKKSFEAEVEAREHTNARYLLSNEEN